MSVISGPAPLLSQSWESISDPHHCIRRHGFFIYQPEAHRRLQRSAYVHFQSQVTWKAQKLHRLEPASHINHIYVSQTKIVNKLLSDHNPFHIRRVSTPLPLSAEISSQHLDESLLSTAAHHRYRFIVGSLAYLAVFTRPYISFTVSVVPRQLHASALRHLSLANWVLRYIADTREQNIYFSSSSRAPLTAYVDSDWAGCQESRRSTTGIIIAINEATVFSQSKLQTLIALSSAETGYIAASECGKLVVRLRRLY